MDDKQHALAAEIRAEMAAQRITALEMQERADIKHGSWSNWLVTAKRPVPYPKLEAVCEVLGVKLSDLLARADERLAKSPPPNAGTAELEDMLSPKAKRDVDKAREDNGVRKPPASHDEDEDRPRAFAS